MNTTRTYLLLALLNLMTVYAFSQKVRMGFLGGANFTLANYDFPKDITIDNAYVSSWQANPGPGLSLGFDIEYDLSDKLFASTGIVLNQYSFKAIKTNDYLNQETILENKYQFGVFELQLPLLLHYRVGKFSAGVGTFAALGVAGKFTFKNVENGDLENDYHQALVFNKDEMEYADFRPVNAGLSGEIGYGVKRWRLAAHLDLGLVNLAPKAPSNDVEVQKYPLKRSSLGMTFLYQPWPR
ncbi:porin family protein [Haliscomenobacter sp.]|uniref:porin family protein n=1 Tax=Haliscomenobacter sp. TaxID=2717303 RepID=UPI003BAC1CE1